MKTARRPDIPAGARLPGNATGPLDSTGLEVRDGSDADDDRSGGVVSQFLRAVQPNGLRNLGFALKLSALPYMSARWALRGRTSSAG